MSENIIQVTPAAADRIRALIAKREKPAVGIKVGVKSGGCSGLTYTFEYADSKDNFDEEISDHGVSIFISPKAILYLVGTILDYKDEKFKSGFIFINPNEKGKCGCGESFYT